REQARGQAERKQVREPEAPVDRVNRKMGDVRRAVRDKNHTNPDISGFINAEIDRFYRSIKLSRTVPEWALYRIADERISNAVIPENAGERMFFVIDECLMCDQIALLVGAEY